MKFEIEIKEEDWKQLDSNSAIQILNNKTGLGELTLLRLIHERDGRVKHNFEGTEFELMEGTEYFYGYMYLPFFEWNIVDKYIFRTKDPKVYRITKMYSDKIDKAMR